MKLGRRENFEIAMSHREPEWVPVDHGKQVSSIHKLNYNAIRREMGLGERDFEILDRMSQCVHTHEDLLQAWDIDFRWLIPHWTQIQEIDADHYRNLFGVLFQNSGDYFSIADSPLREKGMDGLRSYPWPKTSDPAQFAGLAEQAEEWFKKSDYVVGADGIKGGVLQTSLELAGYDQFFMDLVLDPEFAHALLDKVTQLYKEMYLHYLKAVGKYAQCIYLTDDFGSQNSLLMSVDMWREFIKPREAELIAHIKELAPHIKVIFHTDGSVKPLLNDMIEMGVDLLNPVQTSVEELADTAELKAEFGEADRFSRGY
jgi:uroporphyrinogen decarboxylase